jgi:hypothetical protein
MSDSSTIDGSKVIDVVFTFGGGIYGLAKEKIDNLYTSGALQGSLPQGVRVMGVAFGVANDSIKISIAASEALSTGEYRELSKPSLVLLPEPLQHTSAAELVHQQPPHNTKLLEHLWEWDFFLSHQISLPTWFLTIMFGRKIVQFQILGRLVVFQWRLNYLIFDHSRRKWILSPRPQTTPLATAPTMSPTTAPEATAYR